MTKIKLCGLSRPCDIAAANELKPDYVGFVFAPKSKRYVTPAQAASLKNLLSPDIKAVGVFVNEDIKTIAQLCKEGVIDIAQLHGTESEEEIRQLRAYREVPVIKAFCIRGEEEIALAEKSSADYLLLDSGAGTGTTFNWQLIQNIKRPYFLAGGLGPDNVEQAIEQLRPYGVDVSSGIETDGEKDKRKIAAFVAAVRREEAL